jgi:hypothetical protein
MNDEARSTKRGRTRRDDMAQPPAFVIRASFVIRISSFVILGSRRHEDSRFLQ